ncbi:ABC transporter ATP-binding protein [Streptomyces calidiresistens]|uniref:ATP-binding cassette domain-containing protein n=1 Tax=Streptomyces calidiresistens TaxID=1485586 RepID=A0A7W3T0Y8_9ACTN|nr:ATP-binding cassette domain-containing protein [Streptomyces calidiresistens]MBB0228853.1 ATP-binding cassette domain-containing protein [Streptomyces calidiresistens]
MPFHFEHCSFGYRRGRPVLADLSLRVGSGHVALLGPNGAGKSTLMSLAATTERPWSGRVVLDGLGTDNRADLRAWRRRVGWMPQNITAVPGLTVREQVAYAGWLKGLSRDSAWTASLGALSLVNLTEKADVPSGELSGGQMRRVGIAEALVHDADVVLMDEPTAGLDPVQYGVLRDLMAGLSDRVRFLIATHDSRDLADLYTTVIVMSGGEVRFHGDMASFLDHAPGGGEPHRRAEDAYRVLSGAEG